MVDKGDGDASTLMALLEDGSMPKDADPLTKEELVLVKKWIDTGARLDAGVNKNDQLITIMPKPQQPTPPEAYRVPIAITSRACTKDGKPLAGSGYHEVIWTEP